jgi:hypothetical protein
MTPGSGAAHYANAAHYATPQPPRVPAHASLPAPLAVPAPAPTAAEHPLARATVVVAPTGRVVRLGADAGVSAWFVRLGAAEAALTIRDVAFVGGGGDDEDGDAMDEDEDVQVGRKKKGGKRGGGASAKKAARAAVPAKAQVRALVKLNATVLPPAGDEWHVTPAVGAFNVVELGSEGGAMWKIYVQTAQ